MPCFKKHIRILFFSAMVAAAAPSILFCSDINGYVRDLSNPTSPVLAQITVTLTGSSEQTCVTDILGYYQFTGLAAGRYTVTPSSAGRVFTPGDIAFEIVYSTVSETDMDFSGVEYKFVSKWGSYGTGYGQFNNPSGIAVSSLNYVYAADTSNHRIQRFSSSGTVTGSEVNSWGYKNNSGVTVSSDSLQGFNQPFDVDIDSAGWLYVADTYNNRIQKFDPEDTDTDNTIIFGSAGSSTGTFSRPGGICSDNINNVFYVVDTANDRVQQFSSTGVFLCEWGGHGSGDGQFNSPQDAALDSAGNIYVVDTKNHRVQKFIPDFDYATVTFDSQWGSGPGSAGGQFNLPSGIAIDRDDNVYVADTENDRVEKFTSTGVFVAKWGYNGTGSGKFNSPYGIAVDTDNFVYVSENGGITSQVNNRIQKFAPASSFAVISGYIRQQGSGSGMNEISLILKDADTPVGTFKTGPDGYYEFLNLPVKGSYSVTPSSGGYVFNPASISTASLTESATDWDFVAVSSVVVPLYFIQGYIGFDAAIPPEQPVSDAIVYLSGSSSASFTTTTEGFYLFENLPAGGHYTVTPVYEGTGFYPAARTSASLSGNMDDWNFTGFAATYINGYVRDADGNNREGVTMTLTGSMSRSTNTDASGYYEFTILDINGHYTVTPSKLDYSFLPVYSDFTTDTLPAVGADFIAAYSTPSITNLNISGYVRETGGAGVNSANVSLSGGSTGTVVTDSSGYFKFQGLTGRQNYTVTVSKLNWSFSPVSTTTYLDDGDKNDVNFTASFNLTSAPGQIDIPLGSNGNPVQVQTPAAGSAKVIIAEYPGKAAKFRGTVNPDRNEAVGILFTPNVNTADYVNRKFTIKIFSLKGEPVDEFSKIPQTADDIWIKWLPRNLASGIYIIHIEGPGVKSTKKVAVIR